MVGGEIGDPTICQAMEENNRRTVQRTFTDRLLICILSFIASLKSNETAVEDLKLTLGLLVRRMRAAAPSESRDLSWTQKSVLVRLEKEGQATISELARAEGVKPQSMGTAIAALEGMGMVERKADPTDGRQMNIKLTDKGSSIRRTTRDSSLP